MEREKEHLPTELSDDGHPIEIYTDERIAVFLAENEIAAEQRKMVEEKLRQSKRRTS